MIFLLSLAAAILADRQAGKVTERNRLRKVITRRYLAALDENGHLGWLATDAPSSYEPLGGMGAVHDLLEHPPGDAGSDEEEAMAAGAMFLVRGQSGYFHQAGRQETDPAVNFAGDLLDFITRPQGFELSTPPPTRASPRDDEDLDPFVDRILTNTRALLLDHGYRLRDGDETMFRNLRGWIRIGYRDAKARYRKSDEYTLGHAFLRLEQDADKYLSHAEEGDELELSFEPERGRFAAKHFSRYDLYEPEEEDEYGAVA